MLRAPTAGEAYKAESEVLNDFLYETNGERELCLSGPPLSLYSGYGRYGEGIMQVSVDLKDDYLNGLYGNAAHYQGNPPNPSDTEACARARKALTLANEVFKERLGHTFEEISAKKYALSKAFSGRDSAPFPFEVVIDSSYFKSAEFRDWILTNGPDNKYFQALMYQKYPGSMEVINVRVNIPDFPPLSGNAEDALEEVFGGYLPKYQMREATWNDLYLLYLSRKTVQNSDATTGDADNQKLLDEMNLLVGIFTQELDVDPDDLTTKSGLLDKSYVGEPDCPLAKLP